MPFERNLIKIKNSVTKIYQGEISEQSEALKYLRQVLPSSLFLVCLALYSPVALTRKSAVLYAQRSPNVEVLPILDAIINNDPDLYVSGIARMVLGNCLNRFEVRLYDYIHTMKYGLVDSDHNTRQFAVIACGMIDEPELIHDLYKIACNEEEEIETRWYAIVGIGRNKNNPLVRELLIPFLSDNNQEIRHAAVVGLTLQKSPEVQKALSLLLYDPDEKVRYAVAAALLFQGCEDGIKILEDALTGIDETRRQLAAHSISLLRNPKLDNALITAVLNPDTELSWELIMAITFSSKRIKPILESRLDWVDNVVREKIIKLLWHLKWWDEGCIPRMRYKANKKTEDDEHNEEGTL